MKFWTRVKGSTRPSIPKTLNFEPNFAGQGGVNFMTLFDGEKYYCFQPESIGEVRDLQSQAAILALNVREN